MKNMSILALSSLLLGAVSSPAIAATITRVGQRGSSAVLSVSTSKTLSGGCVLETSLSLTASSFVDRQTGSGLVLSGFINRHNTCTGVFTLGQFEAPLTAQTFQINEQGASLNVALPITLTVIQPDGEQTPVTLNFRANLAFQDLDDDDVLTKTRSVSSAPTVKVVTKGRALVNVAALTGQVVLGGTPLLSPDAASLAWLEKGSSSVVTITP